MDKNNMHKAFAWLLAMIVIVCAAVIGWTVAEPSTEQTTAPDPEPLVINTVEDQDDMLLTVIREKAEAEPLVINTVEQKNDGLLTVIRDSGETVFQYEGTFDVWIGADGKTYAMLYLEEEVLQ